MCVMTESEPGASTLTCHTCQEHVSEPKTGMGRAVTHAWLMNHQGHDVKPTADAPNAPAAVVFAVRRSADARAKAHIESGQKRLEYTRGQRSGQAPERLELPVGLCGAVVRTPERLPLEATAEEDRCSRCMKANRV